jgi:DNA (cytosine-5)-methyltransferase 1
MTVPIVNEQNDRITGVVDTFDATKMTFYTEHHDGDRKVCDDSGDSKQQQHPAIETNEYVLIVPKRLTKYAQNILFGRRACPMAYHLEGRWGSRTFRVNETHMGIPVLSLDNMDELASRYDDVKSLLETPDVQISYQIYVEPPKHRAQEPPFVDATFHPERADNRHDHDYKSKVASNARRLQRRHYEQRRHRTPVFTYAEMFAGMGGFAVALDALGGRCVFCSELQDHLRLVYKHNFVTIPNSKTRRRGDEEPTFDIPMYGDIYQVPDSSLPDASSSLDLLVGGFPCQPFSALGEQPGLDCPKSGNLFLEIVRFLTVSRPKAFLLENVPGLLGMTETYNIIVNALGGAGYNVTSEICAARGLTATGRKRLFLVGIRTDIDNDNIKKEKRFEFPFIPDLQLKACNVLDYDDLPSEELDLLRLPEDTFEQLLNGGRWRPNDLAWPSRSLGTLTSHYGNAVGRGDSQLVPSRAPNRPRRFSIRECARIMGFPNWYEFLPPLTDHQTPMGYRKQHYRMIGNAVCPPLIAALAGAVLEVCLDVPPPADCDTDGDDNSQAGQDWVQRGREVAIELALAATREDYASLPRGCLAPREYEKFGHKAV